jgi:hypothetical protein
MSITVTTSIDCDCCGQTITTVGIGYAELKMGSVTYTLCTQHGCASGALATLTTGLATIAAAHQATTVLGVILAH